MTNWLLLHGTPLTPSVWDNVIPALAERGSVTAPALVPPAEPVAHLQHAFARDIVAQTTAPRHVVGHSFGGQVAIEIALQRPELVASVTLLCTRDTPYPAFAALAADVRSGAVDIDSALRRWFSPADLAADGSVVRYVRETLANADRQAWSQALTAIATFDVSARLGAITCPVTLIAAEHDSVSDPQTMAAMAHRLPHCHLRVLDDAWHMSVFTDPARLVALLTTG
ncbi:MAG: alpha/beta fold hydrolase [Mycobacterium sp.]